jgi:hypothetical protein
VEKTGPPLGGRLMRSIYEIQKEIELLSYQLNNLIFEKNLTLQVLWGWEKSAEILTEQAMAKMRIENEKGEDSDTGTKRDISSN